MLNVRYRSVQPSASIQSFDALCEVQSDKASVEITSPFDGVVKELLVREGEIAKVGAGLCVIEVDADEHPSSEDSKAMSPPPHQEQQTHTEPTPSASVSAAQASSPVPPQQTARRPHPLDPNVSSEAKSSSATNA